jgi:hypothetical protein
MVINQEAEMKLIGIDQALTSFDGTPIPITGETMLTRRIALLNCLGSTKPENGKEAVEIWKLGVFLATAEEDVPVKVEDILLLKKSLEQNTPGYFPMILGQLFEYLSTDN